MPIFFHPSLSHVATRGQKHPQGQHVWSVFPKCKSEPRFGEGVRSQEGSAVISLLCDLKELADPLWASVCLQGRGVKTLALISSQGCGEEQMGNC